MTSKKLKNLFEKFYESFFYETSDKLDCVQLMLLFFFLDIEHNIFPEISNTSKMSDLNKYKFNVCCQDLPEHFEWLNLSSDWSNQNITIISFRKISKNWAKFEV